MIRFELHIHKLYIIVRTESAKEPKRNLYVNLNIRINFVYNNQA